MKKIDWEFLCGVVCAVIFIGFFVGFFVWAFSGPPPRGISDGPHFWGTRTRRMRLIAIENRDRNLEGLPKILSRTKSGDKIFELERGVLVAR